MHEVTPDAAAIFLRTEGSRMAEQLDFWLQLHQLNKACIATGATPEERANSLAMQFKSKAPAAQKEAAEQLLNVAVALATLRAQIDEASSQ